MNGGDHVGAPTDLDDLFPESRILGPFDISLSDDDLHFLAAELSAISRPSDHLLIASGSEGEFSWEFVNRLIRREPGLADVDVVELVGTGVTIHGSELTVALAPALLAEGQGLESMRAFADCAVVLVRKDTTRVADVEVLAQLLRAAGFTVRAVVIVDGEHRRWRKWRRFARTYGVWSDPERPWPAIDVLDEEMRRTARSRRSEPGG